MKKNELEMYKVKIQNELNFIESLENTLTNLNLCNNNDTNGAGNRIMYENLNEQVFTAKESKVLEVIKKKPEPKTRKRKNGQTYIEYRIKYSSIVVTSSTYNGVIEKAFKELFKEKECKYTLTYFYNEYSKTFQILIQNGNRSKETARKDMDIWNKYIRDTYLADKDIEKITVNEVYAFYSSICRNMSRKYFCNVKSLFNSIFTYAYNEGKSVIIPKNINTKLLLCKDDFDNGIELTRKPYTRDVAISVVNEAKNYQNQDYARAIMFAFYFDIRIGELKALSWEDVDWEKKTIYIHRSMVSGIEKEERVNRVKNKKQKGKRYQPIIDEALEILKEQYQYTKNQEYIFMHDGKPLRTQTYNYILKRICERAGVEYSPSHQIRFYATTSLITNGAHFNQVAQACGHTNTSMTEHYNRPETVVPIDEETWKKALSLA